MIRFAEIIKVITTEDVASKIPCPIRIQFLVGSVVAIFAMMAMIGLAILNALHKVPFDPSAFGTGFAALLAGFGTYIGGTGMALYMNAKSPDDDEHHDDRRPDGQH